ncbi:hypothetical protein ACIQBJ_05170 [Kitasatospora sp. NPDC088391]|uniref:hypothetical protein n=1 Tax=Kitasatospora sp. NPDC088391 TaxID=3364074 RepID=UPI00381748E2
MTHRTWHRTARSTRLRGAVLALVVAAALAGPAAAAAEAAPSRSGQVVDAATAATTATTTTGAIDGRTAGLEWNSTTSDCVVPPGRTTCH